MLAQPSLVLLKSDIAGGGTGGGKVREVNSGCVQSWRAFQRSERRIDNN